MDGSTFFVYYLHCWRASAEQKVAPGCSGISANMLMRRYIYFLFLPMMTLALLPGCTKDESKELISVTAEHYGGTDAKMYVSRLDSYWDEGDKFVWSNGTVSTIENHGGNYYIPGESNTFSGKTAIFPSSIVSDGTVTLPDVYHYEEDNSGRQKIALPMATYYNGEGHIYFRHITAGMYFTITNSTGTALHLDRITIANASQNLSGSFNVSAYGSNQQNAAPHPAITITNGSNCVAMRFSESEIIPASGSKTVLIPIAAYTTAAANTVTVNAHSETSYYTFEKTQTGSAVSTIACGEVGYASITLSASGDGMTSGDLPFGYPGDGTASNPYMIRTATDYINMVTNINGSSPNAYEYANYEFCNDIDMNNAEVYPMNNFGGVIEGNNHTLSNFTIKWVNGTDGHGLIENAGSGAIIRNFRLDNVSLTANHMNTGTFIGISYNSTLQNCQVGTIIVLDQIAGCFGGFVGSSRGPLTMENCRLNNGFSLSVPQFVAKIGGLIGCHLEGDFICRRCTVTGDISITGLVDEVGGLVGHFQAYRGGSSFCNNVVAPTSFIVMPSGLSHYNIGGLIGYYYYLTESTEKTINSNTANGVFQIVKSSESTSIGYGKITAGFEWQLEEGTIIHSGNDLGGLFFDISYQGGEGSGTNNTQYVLDGNDN